MNNVNTYKVNEEAVKKIAEKVYDNGSTVINRNDLEEMFPELKENEDDRIRKDIISHFAKGIEGSSFDEVREKYKIWIAWLEKQGEQNNNEDADILYRFSFYSYKDEPNILYLAGLYVNDEYRNKGIGTKILEVTDEVAKSLNCHTIRLKTKKDSNAERLYHTHGYNSLATEERDEIWLEKQGKQKPADKVEPKFKIGDWCIDNEDGTIFQIVKVLGNTYTYKTNEGKEYSCTHYSLENDAKLWTIQDAKDGDVLRIENLTFIFQEITNDNVCHKDAAVAYCSYEDNDDGFGVCGPDCITDLELVTPATKEQRDTLESAMTNAGYRWDKEKLKLEKI